MILSRAAVTLAGVLTKAQGRLKKLNSGLFINKD